MKLKLPNNSFHRFTIIVVGSVGIGLVVVAFIIAGWVGLQKKLAQTVSERSVLQTQVTSISAELSRLKSEDQYQKNQNLQSDIDQIEKTYTQAVSAYEDLLRLKDNTKDLSAQAGTKKFDEQFAEILTILSEREYKDATASLSAFRRNIATEQQKIASSFVIPQNIPSSNSAPSNGYIRQSVQADIGSYLVDIIAADLTSTRVIVDTASDATCARDCPAIPLADYVSRNGAYAGVNGSYFCPADYPSCSDKKNSFDTLLMNKNKVYFNSDNNKFSTVPAVIFGSGFVRFVGQSLEWGRDTSIDSMIANQPLLLSGGNIVFGGNSDPKMGSTGSRGFVASRGSSVYIGVVHNVTVAGMAHVLKALGMDTALNLDSGGSVALWSGLPAQAGGYKVGPGRNIPNAILFVRK
jgi:hypothetical protein